MDGLNLLGYTISGILLLALFVLFIVGFFYSFMFLVALAVLFWPWLLLFGFIGLIALGQQMKARS